MESKKDIAVTFLQLASSGNVRQVYRKIRASAIYPSQSIFHLHFKAKHTQKVLLGWVTVSLGHWLRPLACL